MLHYLPAPVAAIVTRAPLSSLDRPEFFATPNISPQPASLLLAQAIVPASDGTGTLVSPSGNQFDITGGSQSGDGANLFHSFQQFGLEPNQIANFIANPQTQNILSRVTGGDASVIRGLIQVSNSQANLFLLNPAGILFGPTASLNVPASFTATTATAIGFGHQWFQAFGPNSYAQLVGFPGDFAFRTPQPGALINTGQLLVGNGQNLTLVGGTVLNTGTLAAPQGTIAIVAVAGQQVVRVTPTGSLLSLDLPIDLQASLAPVPFSPLSLPQLLTAGHLDRATNVSVENGVVKLTSTGTVVPNGPETVILDGNLSVDAPTQGDAGMVRAWSSGTTQFFGTVTARGGPAGGNGGTIALSGKQGLSFQGLVDAGTTQGQPGTLLLDPDQLTIASGGSSSIPPTGPGALTVDPTALQTALQTTQVILQADRSITVQSPVTWDSAHSLFLDAGTAELNGTVTLNAPIAPTGTGRLVGGNGSRNFIGTVNVNQGATPNQTGWVQNAVTLAAPGATINLGAGTFIDPQTIKIDKSLTIQGVDANSTLISGDRVRSVMSITSNYMNPDVTVTLNRLAIVNGTGTDPIQGSVGGLFIFGSTVTLNQTRFSGNVSLSGGAILNNGGKVILNDSEVSGNRATDRGGGILTVGTIGDGLILNRSIVSGNFAKDGGGIASARSKVILNNSTISSNTASGQGGGIHNTFLGNFTLNNSTISGNSAASGGGILNENGSLIQLNNATISANTATSGGGIVNTGSVAWVGRTPISSAISLKNTIVAGNQASIAPDVMGQFGDLGNNLIGIQDGSTGFTRSTLVGTAAKPINSLLAPLANQGGPTPTMALLPGSPAIDAGNNALLEAATTDQRGVGFPRLIGPVDIGAFESELGNVTQPATGTQNQGLPSNPIIPDGPSLPAGAAVTNAVTNRPQLPEIAQLQIQRDFAVPRQPVWTANPATERAVALCAVRSPQQPEAFGDLPGCPAR